MEKNQVIIIPCYNEIKTILSIYNKAKKFGRVVIVDDFFSDDGTRKFLKEKKIFFSLRIRKIAATKDFNQWV